MFFLFKYSILRWNFNENYILLFIFKIEWILDKMKEFEQDSLKIEKICNKF